MKLRWESGLGICAQNVKHCTPVSPRKTDQDWQTYLRPRANLLAGLVLLLLGLFGLSAFETRQALQAANLSQHQLADAARTASSAQRLEVLSAELSGWLSQYALDVNLGGNSDARQNIYAQSFGTSLSELTALLAELRQVGLNASEQAKLGDVAAHLTQLNVLDAQIRDAYASGTPQGIREGTALVRGEAFTSAQALASAASALSRQVVQQAEASAQATDHTTQSGNRRLLWFTLTAAALLLGLAALVLEVVRRREEVVGRLRDLAERDGLTGVANRRLWDDLLEKYTQQARREGTPLSVALIDLDHFKIFNDTHGHQAGDDQLRAVAGLLEAQLAPEMIVARYGGEEFGLLCPHLTPEEVGAKIDALRPLVPAGGTFSAGVAASGSLHTASDTIRRADAALYEAKARGRAQTVLAQTVMASPSAAAADKG